MISSSVIGALIGLVFGIVDFIVLGYAANQRSARRSKDPSSRLALNAARVSQLILFPVVGWFAGPIIVSNLGG